MPGHRCIAPGCKSGYDSCKEKYHFFSVPKDDDKLQQWKKAIPKKDEEIKPRQVVCERHFHEEDILWKRIMTDKNGTSLAEVIRIPEKNPPTKDSRKKSSDYIIAHINIFYK